MLDEYWDVLFSAWEAFFGNSKETLALLPYFRHPPCPLFPLLALRPPSIHLLVVHARTHSLLVFIISSSALFLGTTQSQFATSIFSNNALLRTTTYFQQSSFWVRSYDLSQLALASHSTLCVVVQPQQEEAIFAPLPVHGSFLKYLGADNYRVCTFLICPYLHSPVFLSTIAYARAVLYSSVFLVWSVPMYSNTLHISSLSGCGSKSFLNQTGASPLCLSGCTATHLYKLYVTFVCSNISWVTIFSMSLYLSASLLSSPTCRSRLKRGTIAIVQSPSAKVLRFQRKPSLYGENTVFLRP